MATKTRLLADIHRLMTTLSSARAGTSRNPWLNVGLTMAQVKALMVLHHRSVTRAGALAQTLGLSPNGTTAILDRLEEEGLVRRSTDATDRRAVLAELTKTGDAWVAALLSANVHAFDGVLEQLAAEDLEALRRGLDALTRCYLRVSEERAAAACAAPVEGAPRTR